MFSQYGKVSIRAPLDWRGQAWLDTPDDVMPDGFQFVVDDRTMEPVEIVLRYLTYLMRYRRVRIATERAQADDLYEWLLYCAAAELSVEYAESDDLINYRDRLLTKPSLKTGAPLAASTVRRRLSTIISFYEWADEAGLTDSKVGKHKRAVRVNRANTGDALAHIGTSVRIENMLLPKVQKKLPEFIRDDALRHLFTELGSDPLNADPRPKRDWLIVYLAVMTGMRRAELAALTVRQFQGLYATEDTPARLPLSVTKGDRTRTVPIEAFVLDRVAAYIGGERKAVLTAARAKGKFRHREPISLFLNGPNCAARYLGEPIKEDMIDRMFLRAQRRLVGEEEAIHSFHHLRHSHVMRRKIAGDDWMNISRDLGHAQIGTTIDTYARALNQVEPEARSRYVAALRKLTET